jgi:hypothetical protein
MIAVVTEDFEALSGWTAGAPGDDATSGLWVRGDPHGTQLGPFVVAPEDDHTQAPGVTAFVTGNPGPGALPSEGDVDGGRTTLLSPLYDLSGEVFARLSAWVWCRFPGDDDLELDLSNDGGQTWVPLARIVTDLPEWQSLRFDLLPEHLAFTSQMRVRVIASDYGSDTLVEGGIDDLVIQALRQPTQGVAAGPPAPAGARLALAPASPNPFSTATTVTADVPGGAGPFRLAVYDVEGRLVRSLASGTAPARAAGRVPVRWDGTNAAGRAVAPGVYWIRLEAGGAAEAARVVKLR